MTLWRKKMKILLPIDGSRFSDAAVRSVAEQAQQGIEVRVLHVVQTPSTALEFLVSAAGQMAGYMPTFAPELKAELKRAEELVTKTSELLRSKGLTVVSAVEQGDPKSKIIEEANKWSADLIVIGSHGRKGLEHFLLGSVAEAVAYHAGCSVKIVRIPSKR
jgi:nucleotide-binding universal stress UspA family protein